MAWGTFGKYNGGNIFKISRRLLPALCRMWQGKQNYDCQQPPMYPACSAIHGYLHTVLFMVVLVASMVVLPGLVNEAAHCRYMCLCNCLPCYCLVQGGS